MEFQTEAVKACYEKVSVWLKELFGEMVEAREDFPGFGLAMGSAYCQIAIYPWGDTNSTITCRSYVVTGAETTPELMKYLLRESADLRFGKFGLDEDGDIVFEHTIVGNTVDKEEVRALVRAVIWTADEYDDKIVARFGGERAIDRTR